MARLGRKQFDKASDGTLGFDVEWQAVQSSDGCVAKREEARALYVLFLVRLCRSATQPGGTMVA